MPLTISLKNFLKSPNTDIPCILQVKMRVWYTAETIAILSLPKNKEFLRSYQHIPYLVVFSSYKFCNHPV